MPDPSPAFIPRLPTTSAWWKSSGGQLSEPLLAAARGNLQTLLTLPADVWTPVAVRSPVLAEEVGAPVDAPVSPAAVQVHSCLRDQATTHRCKVVVRCSASDVAGHADNLLSALALPSLLPQWNPLIEAKRILARPRADVTLERITFRAGWPIAPVEALTINQMWRGAPCGEGPLLMRVSTCLPNPDARELDTSPAFLQPQPPYIRRRFEAAWVVEQKGDALCITYFWSDDFPASSERPGRTHDLHAAVMGLMSFMTAPGSRAGPALSSWGRDVRMQRVRSDAERSVLKAEYLVVPGGGDETECGPAHVAARAVHLLLASDDNEGWDITCSARPPSRPWRILVRVSPHQAGSKEVFILHEAEVQMKLRVKRTNMVPTFEPGRVRINGSPIQVWPSNPLAPVPPSALSPAAEHTGSSIRSFSVLSTLSSFSRFSAGSGENKDEPVARYPSPPGMPTPSTAAEAAELLSLATAGAVVSSPRTWEGVFALFPLQQASALPPMINPARYPGPSPAASASIQRAYIYFMSLLEMPDQKWTALSERTQHGVGVSMSQLRNALDSKVVVYRAQATFVGLSIWDWLACLSGPGAGRQLWDESLESAELLEQWGPFSFLWREKTKGWWPVSARDSLLVQTTYKSPNSMHIFAFTPSSQLIAPDSKANDAPTAGTIRTQVDLRAWSIEKLSPTTVRVTLVEQSDPNGWTRTATAVPAAMALAIGGVGHSALHTGPIPSLVGLSHGLVQAAQYDSMSSTSSFCYAPQGGCQAHIRCDSRGCAKSGGMEVEVHPPPKWAGCLQRHRLHPRGGGIWLTLVHETKVEVRVRVRPLRHPPDASTDGTATVLLNGQPMRVISDELSSTRILDLTSTKRTSLRPTALDRGLPTSHSRAYSSSTIQLPRIRRASECTSSRPRSLSLSAPSVATSSTLVPTPSEKGDKKENDLSARSSKRDAMSGALDGLFLLRRIESNLSPDPAATRAGWASVAPLTKGRRGIHISRKTLPSFSSRVAVVRADTVVPYDASAVMATIQGYSSTGEAGEGWWDSVLPLAQFGSGAGVVCTTKDHLPWPFGTRLFYLGSVSALSSTGSYLYATASCSPEAVERLIPLSEGESNLNPRSRPVGEVLLDGWILQPHEGGTRLTHLLAWNWGASVPASMQAWYNLSLLNERIVKLSHALAQPIPHLHVPGAMVQVRGDPREPASDVPWTFSPVAGVTVLEHTWTRAVCLISPSDVFAPWPDGGGDEQPVVVLNTPPGFSVKALMRLVRRRAVDLDAPFSDEELTVCTARLPTGKTQVQVFLTERPSNNPVLIECTLIVSPAEPKEVPHVDGKLALSILRQDPVGPTYVPEALRLPIGVHQNLFPHAPEEKVLEEVLSSPVAEVSPSPPSSRGHKIVLLAICVLLSSLLYLSHTRSEENLDLYGEWERLLHTL